MNKLDRNTIADLYADSDYGITTFKVGRTEWTTDSRWMIRSRLIGGARPARKKNRKLNTSLTSSQIARLLHDYIRDARPCSTTPGRRKSHGYEWDDVMICHEQIPYLGSQHAIRVPFPIDPFRALDRIVNDATNGNWEHRLDPWAGTCSWWTSGARPYPLAVLMRLRFRELEIGHHSSTRSAGSPMADTQ